MTDIEKALAMIAPSAFYEINPENVSILVNAFKAAIEQHEAFRQEVSDAVSAWHFNPGTWNVGKLMAFIIPKPKPDPLVEAFDAVWPGIDRTMVKAIRAALEARGLEIREKNDD